jgi:hypothetical protein
VKNTVRNVVFEIHIIQAFSQNNLNRGRDGAPKYTHLGGVRRHAISSQCWKRRITEMFSDDRLLTDVELTIRTNHLVDQIVQHVKVPDDIDPDRVKAAVARGLAAARIKVDPAKNYDSQYLHFMARRAMPELGAIVTEHLEELLPPPRLWRHVDGRTVSFYGPDPRTGTPGDTKDDWKADSDDSAPASGESDAKNGEAKNGEGKKGKAAKRQEKSAAAAKVAPEIGAKILAVLMDSSKTPALALYGRMVADKKESSVNAACQVAVAVSTHAADVVWDFWTGICDDKKVDESGADMIGTAPYASGACYYRYLAVNTNMLVKNLCGEDPAEVDASTRDAAIAQAKRTSKAFIRAAVMSIPTGKQNSTGASNLPSLVLVNVKEGAAASLSGAFDVPVYPTGTEHGGMIDKSVLHLAGYLAEIDRNYGTMGRRDLPFMLLDPGPEKTLAKAFVERLPGATRCTASDSGQSALDVLIERAVTAAFGA